MAHIVTAPLVVAKKEDGSDLYVYENGQLPDHVSDDVVARLLELGMIAKVDGRTTSKSAKAPTAESN